MNPIDNVCLIDLPEIVDPVRGSLTVLQEGEICWPFPVRRTFFIHDVPQGAVRGGHSHKTNYQLLICASGGLDIRITDSRSSVSYRLDKSDQGLLLPPNIWNDMSNFAPGTVLLVLCSEPYNAEGYINDFEEFRSWIDSLLGKSEA